MVGQLRGQAGQVRQRHAHWGQQPGATPAAAVHTGQPDPTPPHLEAISGGARGGGTGGTGAAGGALLGSSPCRCAPCRAAVLVLCAVLVAQQVDADRLRLLAAQQRGKAARQQGREDEGWCGKRAKILI